MAKQAQSLVSHRSRETALQLVTPPLALQHLWFRLNARPVRSLAIVPAEERVSTLAIAQGLAQVAATAPQSRVLVVNASIRACRTVASNSDVDLDGLPPRESVTENCDFVDLGKLERNAAERALSTAPQMLSYLAGEGHTYSTAFFAVDSALHQTRSLPLIRALDGCVLCFSLGTTSFADARHLITLVGPERILGSVALG